MPLKKSMKATLGGPARYRAKSSLWGRLTDAADRAVFSWKVRRKLYQHLAANVGNGVTLETALDQFSRSLRRNGRVSSARVVGEAVRRLRDGDSLSVAFSRWVPNDEASILACADDSSDFSNLLDTLVETKQQQQTVGRAYRNAAVRPAVYISAFYGVFWAAGKYAIPDLKAAHMTGDGSLATRSFLWLGDFANSMLAILPPLAVIALIMIVRYLLPRWKGCWRAAAESCFPFSYYRDSQGFLWLTGFIAMLQAGVPDVEILRRQSATASPWLRERLIHIRTLMTNGASLPEALTAKPAKWKKGTLGFPNPDLVDSIESFYGFSDFAPKMSNVLSRWTKELETNTVERAQVTAFILEMVMYACVGLIAYAMFSMQKPPGYM